MLDYTSIFTIFVDLLKTATPIGIFLWVANIVINLFFSLAFPTHSKYKRGDF